MKKPKGIKLNKEQKDTLINELQTIGITRIYGIATIKVTQKKRKKMIRLDGNNAGFKASDEFETINFLRANVTEQFKDSVNIDK